MRKEGARREKGESVRAVYVACRCCFERALFWGRAGGVRAPGVYFLI